MAEQIMALFSLSLLLSECKFVELIPTLMISLYTIKGHSHNHYDHNKHHNHQNYYDYSHDAVHHFNESLTSKRNCNMNETHAFDDQQHHEHHDHHIGASKTIGRM